MRTPLQGVRAPYDIPGPTIYFTDWRYVASGGARWTTREGEIVRLWAREDPPGEVVYRPDGVARGVRIVAQPAEKLYVDLPFDKPWERFRVWCTLLKDDGRYRLWYSSCPLSGFGERSPNQADLMCYAESDDALTWRKPSLGIGEFDGRRDTNIVYGGALAGTSRWHGGAVFVDPVAGGDEGYKMVYLGDVTPEELADYRRNPPEDMDPLSVREDMGAVYGVFGAVSSDGLCWRRLPRPLVLQHSDTLSVAYYDKTIGKYVAYLRTWYLGRRCVGRSETDDFSRFPIPENVLTPGLDLAPSDQWYTNARTTIPGAEDYHLMFPALYRVSRDDTQIHLYSSADGIVWSHVPGGPVVSTGPAGSADAGCTFAGCGMVELPDGRWALPCMGFRVPHKYPRTRNLGELVYAVWPKGRLACVRADEQGELPLAPLRVRGNRVRLNGRTKMAGEIRVEAADEKGTAIPGRSFAECSPISGDFLDRPVTWGAADTLGVEPGAAAVLRFKMRSAELFSVTFGDSA